jgi:probable phosphoglycerate mutase
MYHSPQLRATQTAQIAAKFMTLHNPRLVSLQDLAEIDFGPQVEGQPAPTPEQLALYQAWRAGHLEERIAGGESAVEVLERCRRVMHKVQRSKQTAAVVIGHSSHLRLLLVELLGMSLSQAQREIRLANGSITVVDLAVGQNRLVRLNESCHLKD